MSKGKEAVDQIMCIHEPKSGISKKNTPEVPLVADMRAIYDIETEWPEE